MLGKLQLRPRWFPANDPAAAALVLKPLSIVAILQPAVLDALDCAAMEHTGHDHFGDLPPMLIGQHGSSHEWITASAITSLKQTGEYTGTVNALAIDATGARRV